MKENPIIIIGGGLQGLATANALLDRGEQVLLLERNSEVAKETSFANAGMLAPSHAHPWNSMSDIWNIISGIGKKDSPMLLKVTELPSLFFWGLRFLRNSSKAKYLSNTDNLCKLAQHSLDLTKKLREDYDLKYDHSSLGTLKIFRDESKFEKASKEAERLSDQGLTFKSLGREETVNLEPLLGDISNQISGGMIFPNDEAGDAYKFCKELEKIIREKGGRIHVNTEVKRIHFNKKKVNSVVTDRVEIKASRVVLSSGSWTNNLLKNTKFNLSVKPVKGYSLTLDTSMLNDVPRMPLIDESIHTAITPLGYSLRVAGTAEFVGFNEEIHQKRIDYLYRTLENVYPSICANLDLDQGSLWYGFRPMSADGKPYIGATKIEGLFVNTGHGHLGWTLAMGSADLLADMILNKETKIGSEPFLVSRSF
jgi:D-amino-acid dehydrogenase